MLEFSLVGAEWVLWVLIGLSVARKGGRTVAVWIPWTYKFRLDG